MPIRKSRLSAAEARESRSYLDQLSAEGLDIGDDVEITTAKKEVCPLEITPGKDCGIVRDYPVGNVAYVIPVRIVARQPTIVEDVRIDSPWDDYTIDFPCLVERRGRYQFGASSYLPREVLNDHFDRAFRMSRGAMLEGVILAYGCEQIPDELRGGVVPVEFTIVDTLGREARGEILLLVERSVKTDSVAAGTRTWPSVPANNSGEKHLVLGISQGESSVCIGKE